MRWMRLTLLGKLQVAGFLSACSTPLAAPSADTDAAEAVSEGSARAADAGSTISDALSDTGKACNALQSASPVPVIQVASSQPPPVGGSIVDGSYRMTSVVDYTGDGGATGPTGEMWGLTLEIAGSDWQFDELYASPAQPTRHFQHNDTLINVYDSSFGPSVSFYGAHCSWPVVGPAGAVSDYAVQYTATATELILYSSVHVQTLTKQ
jgi:hypothetical protein